MSHSYLAVAIQVLTITAFFIGAVGFVLRMAIAIDRLTRLTSENSSRLDALGRKINRVEHTVVSVEGFLSRELTYKVRDTPEGMDF